MERDDVRMCLGCGVRYPIRLLVSVQASMRREPLLLCRKCVLLTMRTYRAWVKERLG